MSKPIPVTATFLSRPVPVEWDGGMQIIQCSNESEGRQHLNAVAGAPAVHAIVVPSAQKPSEIVAGVRSAPDLALVERNGDEVLVAYPARNSAGHILASYLARFSATEYPDLWSELQTVDKEDTAELLAIPPSTEAPAEFVATVDVMPDEDDDEAPRPRRKKTSEG